MSFWLGKKHSKETREKISEKAKGNKYSLGRKLSAETRQKIGQKNKGNKSRTGQKNKPEHRNKISSALQGKSKSELAKQNMRINHANVSGIKNPNWCGGISYKGYSTDWTETLRRSIRERDRYVCRLCNQQQGDRTHSVHHIDYDKKNCDPKNLITLCVGCNSKVNFNRYYWTEYFKKSV